MQRGGVAALLLRQLKEGGGSEEFVGRGLVDHEGFDSAAVLQLRALVAGRYGPTLRNTS